MTVKTYHEPVLRLSWQLLNGMKPACGRIKDVMSKHLFVFLVGITLVGLTACAAATPLPLPADLVVTSPRGDQRVIAFLYRDERGARLVNSLSIARDPPAPLDPLDRQVWLGDLELPTDLSLVKVAGVQYGLVVAQGDWLPEGQYGPDGLWSRALASPRLSPFAPAIVDLATLLATDRYESQIVQVRAALLTNGDTHLLVEEIGPGGVPAASARQIKVSFGEPDPAALAHLRTSGSIQFGYVEVIGRWRQGRLESLLLTPLP